MTSVDPPRLIKNIVCIAKDPSLAATISSYFNDKNTYFVIIDPPRLDVIHCWFEVMRRRDIIEKMNAGTVIFVGTDTEEEAQMSPSNTHIVSIKKFNDIELGMGFLSKTFEGDMRCRLEDVTAALIYAKQNNLRLIVDEDAPPFEGKLPRGEHLIVVQRGKDLADVIAANYVFGCGAALAIVEGMSNDLHLRVENEIDRISVLQQSDPVEALNALNSVRENLRLIPEQNLKYFQSITFITAGIPYGIAHDAIPACHIRRFPDLGRFLFNNIWMEESRWSVGNSIVFAPFKNLSPIETDFVIRVFTRELGYMCDPLLEEEANVDNLEMYSGFYPYDILHICSHGGSAEGYEVTFEWGEGGNRHVLEAYEVINRHPERSKPDANNMIRVGTKYIFRSFDGEPWKTSKKKKAYLTSEQKMFEMTLEKHLTSRVRVRHVPDLNRLHCYDGWFFGNLHMVEMHPIIFNNSCCSAFDLGYSFIYAGARCYVGTSWPVDNDLATAVACDFYRNIHKMSLLQAFWLATNRGEKDMFKRKNFMFIGTHFSTLCKPIDHALMNLMNYLPQRAATWQNRLHSDHYPKSWKKTFERILKFLIERMEHIGTLLPGAEKLADTIMPIMRVVAFTRVKLHRKCEPCGINEAHKSEIVKELLNQLV